MLQDPTVAIIIPCHNEAAAIDKVIRDFRAHVPEAKIFVYDNASLDGTAEIARTAGAIVRYEPIKGKGNVVRRMFADVDADIYVLVDGDGTYDATSAPKLISMLVDQNLDMVNAIRVATNSAAYRPGHRFGNAALTWLVCRIFGHRTNDMLSGYRIFSRRFVKSFPVMSSGFEIETELTVHALELKAPIGEIPTPYRERPQDSASKLHTFKDGARILRMIFRLVKEERPLPFFSCMAVLTLALGLTSGWLVISDYLKTGQVARFPTAILATGLVITSLLSFFTGLILDTVTKSRQEIKRLAYLAAGKSS